MKSKINNKQEYKKVSCPFCSSTNIIKRGKRKTDNRGLIQRYGCKKCNKRFVVDDGFFKMKNSPQKVTLCLDLFYRGISTRKVQEHLQAFYPHNSSNVSIYKWIIKYSKKISEFTNKLKLKVGQELQFDEMEFRTKGEQSWFIDSIDTKTRFMVSSEFVKSRGQNELKSVLKIAKEKTEKQIEVITTDGFLAYPNVIRKTFGLKKKNRYFGVIHNQVNASRGEGFNHKVERLHSNIRHRTKTFRGFHGSINSANTIMKGFEIYYNFMRIHQAIRKCPYELATDIELENPNKWLELIKLSN